MDTDTLRGRGVHVTHTGLRREGTQALWVQRLM